MLIDKKGFIWIAHNLGISRYDGISFTSFTNPEETSISMTDLVEDNYGRIWCHNFNGQIFYIKDDKMVYLKEYDFKKETMFPRLVLYGDELVATSAKGIFICNTHTLKCKYLSLPEHEEKWEYGTIALCKMGNTVLLCSASFLWYTYIGDNKLNALPTKGLNFTALTTPNLRLQLHAQHDTGFVAENSKGILIGIKISNNNLTQIFKKAINANVNTISIVDDNVWINTNGGSFSLFGNDSVKNNNITTIAKDNEGNVWFCSLSDGLMVVYKSSEWKNIQPKGMSSSDFIKCIKITTNRLVLCSQNGLVLINKGFQEKNFFPIYSIPLRHGSPERIQTAFNNNLLLNITKSIYFFDAAKGKVRLLDSIISSNDIVFNYNSAYMANGRSLLMKNLKFWGFKTKALNNQSFNIQDSLFLPFNAYHFQGLKLQQRCRALMFDSITNSLFASFTYGLQRIKDSHITYVYYQGKPLYVSSMTKFRNKIYAGTFNNGLFVIDGYNVSKVTNNTESPQNAIIKLKCCNNHIWIFRANDIQVLDAANDKFVNQYPFPVDIPDITDVEEDNNNIYLATHSGLYTIAISNKAENVQSEPSLLYTLVNNTDTVFRNDISLTASKNNLLFRLAIPVYKNAEKLHFKYRLVSGSDTTASIWYYTQDAQRDIQFNALKPGSYAVEIWAVKDNQIINVKPLSYSFSIEKPWYNTWWFYVVVLLFTVSASVALYQYRLYQLVKMERMRRKISHDLHDDIGSTLSSINIYSQLAKGSYGNEGYIDTIQDNTVGIINSLDDLVWNINPKNDTLGQLVSRMELFATPLLQQKDISCIFRVKLREQSVVIQPDVRANIYLLFKEIINNVVKHAACKQCVVYLIQRGNKLRLVVNDNGKGFNVKAASQHRNGLHTMAERVKQLKGTIQINSSPGEGTEIQIDCYVK